MRIWRKCVEHRVHRHHNLALRPQVMLKSASHQQREAVACSPTTRRHSHLSSVLYQRPIPSSSCWTFSVSSTVTSLMQKHSQSVNCLNAFRSWSRCWKASSVLQHRQRQTRGSFRKVDSSCVCTVLGCLIPLWKLWCFCRATVSEQKLPDCDTDIIRHGDDWWFIVD